MTLKTYKPRWFSRNQLTEITTFDTQEPTSVKQLPFFSRCKVSALKVFQSPNKFSGKRIPTALPRRSSSSAKPNNVRASATLLPDADAAVCYAWA